MTYPTGRWGLGIVSGVVLGFALGAIDLQAEIDLIRASIQRLIALGEPQTYGEAVDYLRALSLATTALSRLVRTHYFVHPANDPRDELTRDIQQALKEVYATLVAGEPAKA